MRTTLNIPDSVIEDAMNLTGNKNKTAIIIEALKEYSRNLKRNKLISLRGKDIISDGFNADKLRKEEINELYNG